MRNDPIIRAADERFNGNGYPVFAKLLEIVADQSPKDTSDKRFGNVTLTSKTLEKELGLKLQQLSIIFRFLHNKKLLTYKKRGEWITISFPKMADYKDNYTKKL